METDPVDSSSAAKCAAQFGFEAELFKPADRLRGNRGPSGHKRAGLGLVFLSDQDGYVETLRDSEDEAAKIRGPSHADSEETC